MSNIDKRALREIAVAAVGAHERLSVMPPDDIFDISLAEGTQLDADITALNALNSAANPTTVLALLDELEAKDKRIAEMQALARGVKQFSEFQICHYGATEDYAKGYIDCQNNYNKVLFASVGKGE